MGGDGQALSNKRKLVDKQSSYMKADNDDEPGQSENGGNGKAEKAARWKTCSLSLEPLETPICFDTSGHLFAKQSVLNYLLAQKASPEDDSESSRPFALRRLSDVREVTNANDKGEIHCPVTGFLASSGQHDFVGLWSCGHVIASSALGENEGTDSRVRCDVKCPECGEDTFAVRLVLSPDDAKDQESVLRPFLRKSRKRKHSEAS